MTGFASVEDGGRVVHRPDYPPWAETSLPVLFDRTVEFTVVQGDAEERNATKS